MTASLDVSEQPGLIGTGTGLESSLQEGLEGLRDGISDDIIQLKNPCDMLPQIYPITENQADSMNNQRADKALIQPENVQQRSPDGKGGNLAEDLVNLDNVGLSNSGKMEAARSVTPRDKELVQSDKLFSLSDHSSWSSNERSDFEADKISLEPDSEISSLASDKELLESGKINTGDLAVYGNTEKQCNPVSLETIYQSIMEHRVESKIESRRTQLACRKMRAQIRRVAKTCSEFASRMEIQISRLEDDAGSQKVTRETMEKQLEDTQWKLTDLEDRLRRNYLRELGIPEGVEGADPRGFVVALFKEAFPGLNQWEWEREIQRAHRFPFNRKGISSAEEGGRPRAMLISLLNFQARQAVYDLARPNSRRKARGCDFFVRPDFCHTTVEKRWRLRQLIQPLQNKGAQAFLRLN
ncbi:hypothetical protein NDU88_002399 [Pleurodeles waltl]|uniref:BEN domain-containing protein n=1 Tax=Pleurodeles waltl TaxID=8319 RepID=A0AAV7KS08_PLEWA|nr:hypothetical protein NDU88_002399 [Pleurodeles waltl]